MASASTSTAVNTPTDSCYQIFLNHRGPDTKYTFTSHLYRRLVLHGFRVFWDKEEMQVGDPLTRQIHDAIKAACLHVAVFSPRYAESTWCLQELLLMLESKKPIIPVFYGVQPTDVRRTEGEGVYAEALRNLEKKRAYDSQPPYNPTTIQNWRNALSTLWRNWIKALSRAYNAQPLYNPTTIQNWRKALSTVAEISGLELDRFNGDEGELIDKIVESVESVLKNLGRTRLDVAEHPTGLDTAKSRSLQNKNLVEMDTANNIRMHDHLRDLRRNLAKSPELPRRIWRTEDFEDLLQQSCDTDVRGIRICGTKIEEQSFSSCKIKNLQLLTESNWGEDSIPTRQRRSCRQLRAFEQQQMTDVHTLWLFQKELTFSDTNPCQSRMTIPTRYVEDHPQLKDAAIVKGGTQLRVFDRDENREINKKFKILYHRSCSTYVFLNGWSKFVRRKGLTGGGSGDAVEFWWDTLNGRLEIKCLPAASFRATPSTVTVAAIDRDSKITSLPDSLGQLNQLTELRISRCWMLREVSFKMVEGERESINCPNLQHLQINHCKGLVEVGTLPDALTTLELTDCHKLRKIEWASPLSKLRVLSLDGCTRLEQLPSLETLVSLEELHLRGFEKLAELPSDIGELKSLKYLNLDHCRRLESLPDSLGQLNQLTELRLHYLGLREVSFKMVEGERESICPNLQHLHISSCYQLVEVGTLPDALTTLELSFCDQLRKIEWSSPLSKLRVLNLQKCYRLEQLPSLETLVSLEELDTSDCEELRSIRGLAHLPKLRTLNICGCRVLEEHLEGV